jgi:glycosyltransferase involved in cell wall biosynthesis
MRMRMNALYVGPFIYPDDGAEARRVTGIGLSLLRAGFDVRIGCGNVSNDDSDSKTTALFDVINMNERYNANASRLFKAWRILTWGGNTANWIKNVTPRPHAVFLYGGRLSYLFRLIPWCHANHTPLIVDVVEWYDARHVLGGPLGPLHLSSELAMRYFHVKAKYLIVISRYLERYYQKRGCRTIRIPPTLDVQTTSARLDVNSGMGPLILAYTGVPGKKDLLNNVVEALLQMDPEGHHVRLVVAGPKPEELFRFPALRHFRSTSLPSCVKALGHLSHKEALNVVREADFSVLLRPRLRYAQAGFPTKVPESLAVGTPVMCNITSDLGDYIYDGREGLICRNESVVACMETIERAIRLKSDQKESMRRAARSQAERSFDFRNYSDSLDRFIQEACLA